jgi:hypothetical protein
MSPKRAQATTVGLKLRMKEPLRAAIERAAKRRGVSMNSEINDRLEEAYAKVDALGGPRLSEIIKAIAQAMRMAGSIAASDATGDDTGKADWLKQPYPFNQAVSAVLAILDAIRPPGDVIPPTQFRSDFARRYLEGTGKRAAWAALAETSLIEKVPAEKRRQMADDFRSAAIDLERQAKELERAAQAERTNPKKGSDK